MQAEIQAGKVTPPYVSFTTLDNVLDRLGGGAMPPRLDKGYLEIWLAAPSRLSCQRCVGSISLVMTALSARPWRTWRKTANAAVANGGRYWTSSTPSSWSSLSKTQRHSNWKSPFGGWASAEAPFESPSSFTSHLSNTPTHPTARTFAHRNRSSRFVNHEKTLRAAGAIAVVTMTVTAMIKGTAGSRSARFVSRREEQSPCRFRPITSS